MKPKKHRRPQNPTPPASAAPTSPPPTSPPSSPAAFPSTRLPRKREWLFRIAALALPIVLLALVEIGFRLAHYGYPTHFFVADPLAAHPTLIENDKFGWRFFPRPLARAPRPFSMAPDKKPLAFRIFVLGESAAMGDPEPGFGFARILQVLLQEHFPSTQFEVVNTGMTAINSNVILPIAQDCASQNADLWIIYMGNNEMVGPFGARTVFSEEVPPRPLIRARVEFLGRSRTAQWLDHFLSSFNSRPPSAQTWAGMEMFLDKQVRASDPRARTVYGHFRNNLDDILRAGQSAHVKQILCTVSANLKDCAPFASQHSAHFPPANESAWQRSYTNGITAENQRRFADALQTYAEAAQIDPEFAELQFRIGRCCWALGRFSDARRHWEQARDLDTLRFRSDTEINRIITAAAADHADHGVYFLNTVELLARHSPHQIPGDDLFYDHVHLNFAGNYLLARELAEKTAGLLSPSIASRAKTNDWLSADASAQRLAWTGWDRHRVWSDLHHRFSRPPFSNQLHQIERSRRIEQQLASLAKFTQQVGLSDAADAYQLAIRSSPDDWELHERFAELLTDSGNLEDAVQQWRQAARLLPHFAPLYLNLGNAFASLGQSAEAQTAFTEALRRQPGHVEAMNGLGLALAAQQKFQPAIDSYLAAIRLNPAFAPAHVNLGIALEHQNQTPLAIEQYHQALQLDPRAAAAHANLGRLLAAQGKLPEATVHLAQAVRLMPGSAGAHFNLANAFLSQNQDAAAMAEYDSAVQLNPGFVEARVNLGLLLLRQGKLPQAISQLSAAVQLNPESAKARINLGMALAKQRNLPEAVAQFREALRLEPDNPAAKKYLDLALTQLNSAQ